MDKIFQFDDNSSLIFSFKELLMEIVLQGKTESGFTSANIKLTKEETIQLIDWIKSLNH